MTLPNVRHLKVVLPLLLAGEWRYDPEGGLLDQTHLRFFTRKTALELVKGAGLEVTGYSYTGMEPGSKTWFADRLTFGLFREFFQAGFLFQAKCR